MIQSCTLRVYNDALSLEKMVVVYPTTKTTTQKTNKNQAIFYLYIGDWKKPITA